MIEIDHQNSENFSCRSIRQDLLGFRKERPPVRQAGQHVGSCEALKLTLRILQAVCGADPGKQKPGGNDRRDQERQKNLLLQSLVEVQKPQRRPADERGHRCCDERESTGFEKSPERHARILLLKPCILIDAGTGICGIRARVQTISAQIRKSGLHNRSSSTYSQS
ncbi:MULTISPECIES: hypothetical protein [unclassified Aurantimonas]|uniref:hypothetical protein n=1 Tax=unclassified Aurantimonas TaxID=2638230 RepID=UPI002E1889B1|nr:MULTISPECIES: hypothetical protein [unclassified Aurantimonas]MEC5293448.1 hypothetical protein [Aurantimonas sp. C2-3-R2]MEC5414528.1 hypothetical protein [Aurantimonas sp. C2-4-R8]